MVQAKDASAKKEKHKLTTEQQQVMDSMLAKYDANKDGKLDKTEYAAMTHEDKEKMAQAGLNQGKNLLPPPMTTQISTPKLRSAMTTINL